MPRPHRLWALGGIGAVLGACSSPPVAPSDAEVGSLGTCAAPRRLGPLELGASLTLELGPDAWRFLERDWGVQLEVETPDGAGSEALVVTARDVDALQAPFVSGSGCTDGPAAIDLRATGDREGRVAFPIAEGLVPIELDVDARDAVIELTVARVPSSPPTLETAVVLVDAQGVEVVTRGSDAEGDVARAEIQALDAADAPVSFRGGAGRAIEVGLGEATPGDFALRGFAPLETALGVARGAWVTVFDATGARSGRARAAVYHVERVGLGAACDEGSLACSRELSCQGTCTARDDADAFCGSAPTAALAGEVEVPLTADAGLETSCTPGERVRGRLAVTLPEGAFDLLVAAAPDELGLFGLAARTACTDPASELACARFRETLELLDVGTREVTVLVSLTESDPSSHVTLSLTVRPILDVGAACDPGERADRCRAEPCDAIARRCP